jgi:hypothetical protein
VDAFIAALSGRRAGNAALDILDDTPARTAPL